MPKNREQGSVTITLCLLFLVFILLTGVLVDSARFYIGSMQAKRAIDTATQSVLAEYDIRLKDRYGLFGYDKTDKIATKIEAYAERILNPSINLRRGNVFYQANYLLKNKEMDATSIGLALQTYYGSLLSDSSANDDDFIMQSTEDNPQEDMMKPELWSLWDYEVKVDAINTGVSNNFGTLTDTATFKNQVLQYMKYRGPLQTVEEFLAKLDIVMRSSKSAGITEKRYEVEKKMSDLKDKLSEIIKWTDGWYIDFWGDYAVLKGDKYKELPTKGSSFYCF